ncbi:MAG: hypothetical protein M3P44_06405 [Actinomycetota bacterium]|nr:hypothetical protein [Actinomycetota bacterium]
MNRTPIKEHDMLDLSIIGARQATELTRAQFGSAPTSRRLRLRPRPAI